MVFITLLVAVAATVAATAVVLPSRVSGPTPHLTPSESLDATPTTAQLDPSSTSVNVTPTPTPPATTVITKQFPKTKRSNIRLDDEKAPILQALKNAKYNGTDRIEKGVPADE